MITVFLFELSVAVVKNQIKNSVAEIHLRMVLALLFVLTPINPVPANGVFPKRIVLLRS